MQDFDPILLKVLLSHPLMTEADAMASRLWWQFDGKPGETLVDFLIRQQVFVPDAVKNLELLRKGLINTSDLDRFFNNMGHHRLRDFARKNGLIERMNIMPPVMPAPEITETEAPPPGSKIKEIKQWLANRTQSRQPGSNSDIRLSPPRSTVTNANKPPTPPPAPPAPKPDSRTSGVLSHGSSSQIPSQAKSPSGVFQRPAGMGSGQRKPPESGMDLGKYLLMEQIGHGGTAVVFRALHKTLQIPVAIKFLKFDCSDALSSDDDQTVYQQLKKEAMLLGMFNHPNIVRVFDFEESSDYPFLVMEFVEGLSLSDSLIHCGRIRPDRAAKIMAKVAEGLASAQQKTGLVHRDIKPANILLSRDGGVKLADLGLALTQSRILDRNAATATSAVLAGTVAYMSPEQSQASGQVDHRSDIYSLGATLYHSLTGEMPFKGKTRIELMYKHTKEPITPPHHLVPGLDPLFSDIVMKMMAKEPEQRFQEYDELIHVLKSLESRSDACIALPSTLSHASAPTTT